MKKRHSFVAMLAIALVTALTFTACGGGSSTAPSDAQAGSAAALVPESTPGAEGNVLRVGMECAYAPFNWTQLDDSNGAVPLGDGTYAGGYDVEIAKRVAESMGMELVIVKTEWNGLPPSLTSGKIDAVIAGMSNTAERRETIDFTDDYYTSDLVIVVQKDGPYANATSLADFEGAKITGQMSTFHYDLIDQIPGVNKQPAMQDFPTMVAALTSGRIDGYVSERPGAISAETSNSTLTFVGFEGEDGFEYGDGEASIAIGIRKGDTELKEKLNAALALISPEEREQLMTDAVLNQPVGEG